MGTARFKTSAVPISFWSVRVITGTARYQTTAVPITSKSLMFTFTLCSCLGT